MNEQPEQLDQEKLNDEDAYRLNASSSIDHEDELIRRRNSARWAGGDNLSTSKMSLMLSHMKNRLSDLTQNDEEMQRLAISEGDSEDLEGTKSTDHSKRDTPVAPTSSNDSSALKTRTPLNGTSTKPLSDSRSKSPANANGVPRRHVGDDEGSVISSYSRRSTISKSQGSVSAQKSVQRSSLTATPSKSYTSSRAATPNKNSSTSASLNLSSMKTPTKPQSLNATSGGSTTPTLNQRKSLSSSSSANGQNSAPGSRSSSANRSRSSTTTTTTTSTLGHADRRLYNHENTRRLSDAPALSASSSTASVGGRPAAKPAGSSSNASASTPSSAARGSISGSKSSANNGPRAGGMKAPPAAEKTTARAPSAQRKSITAPSSASKVTSNASRSGTASERSQSANPNEKRLAATTSRSRRGVEPIVVPSANLLRSSSVLATTSTDNTNNGPLTPNKAAAPRRPSIGGNATIKSAAQSTTAIKQESVLATESEPKTADLQNKMKSLANKFAALKVKSPALEDDASNLDSPAGESVSTVPSEAPIVSTTKKAERDNTGRLSRSNSGSSATGSNNPIPFMEKKCSMSPVMVRAGSSTNVISPPSPSSNGANIPFHRTGSMNQMSPNTDRVLRSYDELDNITTSNNSDNPYGFAQSHSSSGQNLVAVPLKIRLEYPARQVMPPEPSVYMESLQHTTPVAIQAIYRAAPVSANSSPVHKASSNNSSNGTPKSLGGSGKKKSGW